MIENFNFKERYDVTDLIDIVEILRSPGGCPWDIEQDHKSIRRDFLEETYEVIEAINKDDRDGLLEELGDVLLQVVFHCDMSERAYEFNFNDVVSGVCEKLVSRHTHIFGQDKASDPEGALQAWDNAKAKEKHAHSFTEQIERLPVTFPATFNIQKIIKKANKNGATVTKEQAKEKLLCAIREDDVEKIAFYSVVYSTLCGRDPEVDLAKSASELKRVSEQLDKDGKLDKLSENI
jgi:tetrapyrrole methylase family protein/MazG family protein